VTTPDDLADLSLALVARALEKAQGALGVPALDELHKRCPATFAALATALAAAEADVKALRSVVRGRQPMHPGLAASIEAVMGEPHSADEKCEGCGEPFTHKDIDGGRCLSCGRMIA
jgi:hypothetical protein